MSYQEDKLEEIADAIREVSGKEGLIKASDFAEKIKELNQLTVTIANVKTETEASVMVEVFRNEEKIHHIYINIPSGILGKRFNSKAVSGIKEGDVIKITNRKDQPLISYIFESLEVLQYITPKGPHIRDVPYQHVVNTTKSLSIFLKGEDTY